MGQARTRLPRIAETAVERARLTVVPRRRPRAPRVPFMILVSLVLSAAWWGCCCSTPRCSRRPSRPPRWRRRPPSCTPGSSRCGWSWTGCATRSGSATRAQALGMVPLVNPAFIRLSDGKVLGNPVAGRPRGRAAAHPAADPQAAEPAAPTRSIVRLDRARGTPRSADDGARSDAERRGRRYNERGRPEQRQDRSTRWPRQARPAPGRGRGPGRGRAGPARPRAGASLVRLRIGFLLIAMVVSVFARPAVPAAGRRRRRRTPRRRAAVGAVEVAAGDPRLDHRPQRRPAGGVARRADDRRRPDARPRTTPRDRLGPRRRGSASTTSRPLERLRRARHPVPLHRPPGPLDRRARAWSPSSRTPATRGSTPGATRCAATRPRTSRRTSSASSTPRASRRPALERIFDTLLAGKDGSATYDVGGGNRIPLGDNSVTEPVDGKDLALTIDRDLQWYTQRVLRQTVEDAGGESRRRGRDGHPHRRAARAGRLPDVRPERPDQRARGRPRRPGRSATSTSPARCRRC